MDKGNECKVCGLRQDQLPPMWRFIDTATGEMKCLHKFGIPAKNVPDWRTHEMDGTPYKDTSK